MEVLTCDYDYERNVTLRLSHRWLLCGRGGGGDTLYKPGTFILVNVSKESERSSRTRPMHTPAEVRLRFSPS